MRTPVLLVSFAIAVAGQQRAPVRSRITVAGRDGRNARVVHVSERLFEAPNW